MSVFVELEKKMQRKYHKHLFNCFVWKQQDMSAATVVVALGFSQCNWWLDYKNNLMKFRPVKRAVTSSAVAAQLCPPKCLKGTP